MKCPVCDEMMRTIEKHNVELDICPGCKGIWLDRGELDKILEYIAQGGPHAVLNQPIAPAISTDVPVQQVTPQPTPNQYHRPSQQQQSQHERMSREHDHDHEDDHRDRNESLDEYGRPRKRRQSWIADILGSFGDD